MANLFLTLWTTVLFELYKNQLPMFDPEKLLDLAKKVEATHIVLPDHPAHPSMVLLMMLDVMHLYLTSRIWNILCTTK